MMLYYIWTYTIVLALLWWVFAVARIHAYKFKSFSNYITKVTGLLFISLLILSLLWYWLILFSDTNNSTVKVEKSASKNIEYIDY